MNPSQQNLQLTQSLLSLSHMGSVHIAIVRLLIEVDVFKKVVSTQNQMEVIYCVSGITIRRGTITGISISMYMD